jgi:hypothetical protein
MGTSQRSAARRIQSRQLGITQIITTSGVRRCLILTAGPKSKSFAENQVRPSKKKAPNTVATFTACMPRPGAQLSFKHWETSAALTLQARGHCLARASPRWPYKPIITWNGEGQHQKVVDLQRPWGANVLSALTPCDALRFGTVDCKQLVYSLWRSLGFESLGAKKKGGS